MRLLLDTHIFLWYVAASPRLPTEFHQAIQDGGNDVFLSTASIWESVIKSGLGKLQLPAPAEEYLPRQRVLHQIQSLTIDEATMVYLGQLPLLHRDPFDRILIAQAVQHDLILLTRDPWVLSYPVKHLLS